MPASEKPTILIVSGAWHGQAHFGRVSKLLNAQAFPTSCPALASVGGSSTATMYDDANIIRAELDKLIVAENKDVIVIVHSYGGVVGAEAVHASLGRPNRQAQGLLGGVINLIYMSAFMLPVGKSMATPVDGKLPPEYREKDGLVPPPMPELFFYNDLSSDDKTYYISLLQPQSGASFLTPLTYAAWQHHPVSYLFCKNDSAIVFEKQQQMVADSGIESRVERFECNSGHSPFLSQPQVVVDMVQKVTEQCQEV